jgi:hypothetical protein
MLETLKPLRALVSPFTALAKSGTGAATPRNAPHFLVTSLVFVLAAACSTAPGDDNTGSGGAASANGGALGGNGGTASNLSGAGGGGSGTPATGAGAGNGSAGFAGAGGLAQGGAGGIAGSLAAEGGSRSGSAGSGNAAGNGDAGATTGGRAAGGAGSGGGASGGGGGGGSGGTSAFSGKELFILFGQSNMSGMSPMPQDPWPIDENVTFMVQYDCPSLDQTKDQWLPAEPPLHGCQWATGGIGLGLADHFGAALAEAWPEAQIGLIPNAIPAVTIEIFTKGGPSPGGGLKALPDGYTSAYTLMVDRVKEAQKLGRVRAILLHQGESDFNQGFSEEWIEKLAGVVADLRADLDLTEEVPFIAGEISPASSYSGHNVYVNQVPAAIPNSAVVSAEGTDIHDVAHFDAESARLMGERYAQAFLELVGAP